MTAGARHPPRLRAIHRRIVACARCPRLRAWCECVAREKKAAHRDERYWGKPVPGFGDPDARVLVLGLAPAAHGANRTGRVFTGDGSGDFALLVRDGVILIKFWFSVSRKEQITRFTIRRIDPVRQWKLSPMDLASLDRWHDYTAAKEAMFWYTDTAWAPWTVVRSNDKKRGRLEAMRWVLSKVDYPDKNLEVVGEPDPLIVGPPADIYETEENTGRVFPAL